MAKRTNQGMMEKDLYGAYKGSKYGRRRKLLKQGQNPLVQFGRKWKKASTLAKVGIGAAALVGTVMNRILPGSPITGIAQPIAAYAAGGAVGAVTSVILNGGLSSITGFLGGQQAATPSVGNVEFGV